MVNTVIAIYPGRFQPMGRHHYDAYKWLANKFGKDKTFIATSDKVELPKSPLSFKEKKSIADKYGIGSQFIQVKNPYKAEEIVSKFDPETTAIVFMVGSKDMQEDPRFKIGKLKSGKDSYFQVYNQNKPLAPYTKHGYLIIPPHVSLQIPGYGEMSGTEIRKALSNNPKDNSKLFKAIFGFEDPKLQDLLYKKFSQTNSINESILKFLVESIVEKLIIEQGAAGHMAHPFDIPTVKNGNDLIKLFNLTAKSLENNKVPVKIDGVNASIRLANIGGKKQFVLDRGSNKPLDVKGITKSDLIDRFGDGHGMIKIGGTVIDIFNKAFPKIKTELNSLGVLNNPNIMFNIEYVEGKSNVQEYENNFLAIHNLLEIKQISPTKRATVEIPYDKKVMQSLIKKLNSVAAEFGFEVMGEIPATLKNNPNFGSTLSKNYTVNINNKDKDTKSLKNWLSTANNTKGLKLKLKSGKVVDALSKQVFVWIKDGKPISELVADPKDYKIAIDSYVIYNATMLLGDSILNSMTSPLGDVNEQEGIVIRDPKIYDKPYKITGSFIIRGLDTAFGK